MEDEMKKERLKPLSFYGHSLEDVIRAVMRVDPKPLWEEEKRLREKKKQKKDGKEMSVVEKQKLSREKAFLEEEY